jgi:hypothetical protein
VPFGCGRVYEQITPAGRILGSKKSATSSKDQNLQNLELRNRAANYSLVLFPV